MNKSETSSASSRPLEGLLVVSLEQALAAPLATCRLADAGARVIKVERAEGDFARGYDSAAAGMSSYFAWTNRGKESIVLNFKAPTDLALLHRLLGKADIFVQNLAAGALERVGLDSRTLRARYPRLITCDISGYGDKPEVASLKAYDLLVQCESGLVSVSGSPEGHGRIGVSICDIGAGMNAAYGLMIALLKRERTGLGSGVAVSLFDTAAEWMTVPYVHEVYGKGAPPRLGLKHPSIAPYGAFRTKDAVDIVISIQNDREWRAFCEVALADPALPQDPRFATNNARVENRSALEAILGAAFATWSTAEALDRLARARTAYGQVRSVADLAVHSALRTLPMQVCERTLEMIASPVRVEWDGDRLPSAPALGEHTSAVRSEFAA